MPSDSKFYLSKEEEQLVSTFNDVWRKLSASKEYRSAFASAQFKRLVPFQIRALRKIRRWSQEQLADSCNLTQGVISRSEDSDNGNLTVNTILKIAEGFDVAFVGRFVPFSKLDEWFINLSEDTVRVPSFEDEDRMFRSGRLPLGRRNSRRISRPMKRARPHAVFIDTRGVVPLPAVLRPTAGENQLPLPLSDLGSGAGFPLFNAPSQTSGSAAITNRIQNAAPGTAQMGGGF
jgi:transcriptional regulator with XRE-family HTH domain